VLRLVQHLHAALEVQPAVLHVIHHRLIEHIIQPFYAVHTPHMWGSTTHTLQVA
jgi:hypothetical protein